MSHICERSLSRLGSYWCHHIQSKSENRLSLEVSCHTINNDSFALLCEIALLAAASLRQRVDPASITPHHSPDNRK
jgi:hypothetical protein